MGVIAPQPEDLLEAKLHEVGSVQHEEDERQHQPGSSSEMNLPVLKNSSSLAKKHATFDEQFYAPGNSQMFNKGSIETLGDTSIRNQFDKAMKMMEL